MIIEDIREQLKELAEENYRIFTSALTPGKANILGVRLPILRKLAANIAKGDYRTFLEQANATMDVVSDDGASMDERSKEEVSLEELMLQGMVIGCCKAELEEVLHYTRLFVPRIDCWSVCDSFCNGLKITKNNKQRVWEFLQPYLNSDKEYELRFGIVMMFYYVDSAYAPLVFAQFDRIKHEGYYVKMAIAWVISGFYVSLPLLTMDYLKKNELDDFTYNKALQKITESLRVSIEDKAVIRAMKRKIK